MSTLRDSVEAYIKRVKELAEHCKGNEQQTKQSLIGPFFTMLGYDLTDPRECLPEYKADFGKDRSSKPIDWGFKHSGQFAFFVEAKEVGKKLAAYDEQLGDYFAKDPMVKLGILTSGVQWRFFTDIVNSNVMDKEPFAKWDILADDPPPFDVITLLQKSQFNAELIRTYAQRLRQTNHLVTELNRLLEPSSEFTKLAIANIETRNLTAAVVDGWKPIVASAVGEWAKQRMLTSALAPQPASPSEPSKIVTSKEELDSFEIIKKMLGSERPIAFEDSAAYFKIHLTERKTWVFARLYLDRKVPMIAVPLPQELVARFAPDRQLNTTTTIPGWTTLALDNVEQIGGLGELIIAAYQAVKAEKKAE